MGVSYNNQLPLLRVGRQSEAINLKLLWLGLILARNPAHCNNLQQHHKLEACWVQQDPTPRTNDPLVSAWYKRTPLNFTAVLQHVMLSRVRVNPGIPSNLGCHTLNRMKLLNGLGKMANWLSTLVINSRCLSICTNWTQSNAASTDCNIQCGSTNC